MALLFDSGLQGNSPFYAGYEYTAPNITAPTGLITLANLMSKIPTETTTKKQSKDSDDNGDKVNIVPGTYGTTKTIIDNLDSIDSAINSTRNSIYEKVRKAPTFEEAQILAKDDIANLRKYYALKQQVKDQISKSNTDLSKLVESETAYKTNNSLSEIAVKNVGGVFVPVGADNSGNPMDYNYMFGALRHSDNTVKDENGLPIDIKSPDYQPSLSTQKGSFDRELTDYYKIAKETEISGGGEQLVDPDSKSIYAGFITGYENTNNSQAVLNAAEVLKNKEKLSLAARADAAAQMVRFAYDNPKDKLFTPEEVVSIQKSVSDPNNISGTDIKNIDNATTKYIAKRINDEKKTYLEKTTKSTLKGGGGSGAGSKKKNVIINENQEKNFKVRNDSRQEEKYNIYNSTVKEWNISDDPLVVTVATPKYAFNPKTGKEVSDEIANREMVIKGIDYGVINPTYRGTRTELLNTKQYWVWGEVADYKNLDKKGNPTTIQVYTKLEPTMKALIEKNYDVNFDEIKQTGKPKTVDTKKTTTTTTTPKTTAKGAPIIK